MLKEAARQNPGRVIDRETWVRACETIEACEPSCYRDDQATASPVDQVFLDGIPGITR